MDATDVHSHEGLFRAPRKHVDLAGHHFLTCPAVSRYEDRGISLGYLLDQETQRSRCRPFPDKPRPGPRGADSSLDEILSLAALHERADLKDELRRIKRLYEVVVGA